MTATSSDLLGVHSALSEVREELIRADQKASILLALFSAIAAGIAAIFIARDSGVFALRNSIEWVAWIGIAGLAGSFAQLLHCVRPGGISRLQGRRYFAFYARFAGSPADLVTHMSESAGDGVLGHCTQLIELSVLATEKYRRIARAVDLLGCALALIAEALLLDAIH
ncbi:Pycsar system effector family protein [Streptomyces sp. NPDC007164]|uniref:Pycsar system effector family protein n=1 Tax=Streptomyces sp. NPDC007164 TaxID=3156918 RepID=UPI0033F485DF